MNAVPLILKLDITGNPTSWIDYIEAIRLYTIDHIVASLGTETFLFRGGINAITLRQSKIEIASIILTRGRSKRSCCDADYIPHLTIKRYLVVMDIFACIVVNNLVVPYLLEITLFR